MTRMTRQVWAGNSVSTSIVNGSWTVINFGTPSTDPLGLGSGASLTSQRGFGEYIIDFTVVTPNANFQGSLQLRLKINGSVVLTETFGDSSAGTSGKLARLRYRGAVPSGQTIQVEGQHEQNTQTVGAAACEVVWVPS